MAQIVLITWKHYVRLSRNAFYNDGIFQEKHKFPKNNWAKKGFQLLKP